MTISTYTELKTAIGNWTHRTDLSDRYDEFIDLAESRINRDFGFNQQEVESALTATIDSRFIALPAGFIAPINMWLTFWTPRHELTYSTPDKMYVTDVSSVPDYWAIDVDQIAFNCPALEEYTFDFRYYKTIALSDSNTTNWMLTNHPDVYLYACLMEAGGFIRDQNLISLASAAYQVARDGVNYKEHRTKAMEELRTDIYMTRRPNILTGEDW